MTGVTEVLAGRQAWHVMPADCLSFLAGLPDQSVDLVFGSPPYEQCRLYLEDGADLGIARKTEEWVAWMVEVYRAALRVCRGLVALVVGHGQVNGFRWSGAPALLCADLIRAGITLRDPKIYHRVGIPGSGGPDDLRKDFEWIVCATNGGRLPWSEPTACGRPPKYAPGGEMSYRGKDGARRNALGVRTDTAVGSRASGRKDLDRESYRAPTAQPHTKRRTSGAMERQDYTPPALANPGNLIACKVGGGNMGDPLCHANEAPFPEKLAEFFVRTFCPPGGVVCDPFCGSGTTLSVAVQTGRRGIGCDVRASQVELTRKRVGGVTPPLFA